MQKIRCAIYTRKSSEEGLEQEFNSLHAQREACTSYIASQKAEGWVLLPTAYDDGGISGGTLERPALQQLLADIDAGLVDQIVVYKIDRLTRSLADFAKIVDRLDTTGTSFVSVTQSFNTATSMGRLTLNMLLSFAQFEREVTAERIRDKIAASKRKGLWMGGSVPLGYDPQARSLKINEDEATTVRTLYDLYRRHGTIRRVKVEADRLGLRTKQRTASDGTRSGGHPFHRGHIHQLLTNPVYAGRIRHLKLVYEGQHPAIIPPEEWDAIQEQMRAAAAKPRIKSTKDSAHRSLLAGKLFDETADRLTPSHTKHRSGTRLRYYVSHRLIRDSGEKDISGWRLPGPMLEETVVHLVRRHLEDAALPSKLIDNPTTEEMMSMRRNIDALIGTADNQTDQAFRLIALIRRIDLAPGTLSIMLDVDAVAGTIGIDPQRVCAEALLTRAPFRMRKRGVETKFVLGDGPRSIDRTLISNIARALTWLDRITTGKTYQEIAAEDGIPKARVQQAIGYAFLAPDIIRSITEGKQPIGLTSDYILHHPLPIDWTAQRKAISTL